MEALLIGLIGLGGLYTISKQQSKEEEEEVKESFGSINKSIMNKEVNVNNDKNQYINPNTATDRYFQNNVVAVKQEPKQYSLNGNELKKDEFKHNNMKPFFGSKSRGTSAQGNSFFLSNESALDSLAGTGSQHITKKEVGSFFKPEDNVQWAHGAPNMSEFYRSRINPGNKMSNVKPWEEEQVGPGLNQGFSNEGTSGFNSGMEARDMWQPKTVDDLRITTNPKLTFSLQNHEGPAGPALKSMIERGRMGVLEKNLPDTYFEHGPERYLTTTGAEKAQTIRSLEILPFENRSETSRDYQGIATGQYKKGKVTEKYEPPLKEHVYGSQLGVPSNVGRQSATDEDYGKNSFVSKANNRNTLKQGTQLGTIQSTIGAVVAPIMDFLRPSRKEFFTDNNRMNGNIQKVGAGGDYIFNPEDKLKTTIKEMTSSTPFHMNVQQQKSDGYMNTRPVIDLTQRDTSSVDVYGNAISSGQGHRIEDAERNQRNNNKKDIAYNYTAAGNTNHFNNHMNICIDSNRGLNNNNNPTYMTMPSMPANIPNVDNYGKISGPQMYDQTVSTERINPDILKAFKENPFTHSLHNSR